MGIIKEILTTNIRYFFKSHSFGPVLPLHLVHRLSYLEVVKLYIVPKKRYILLFYTVICHPTSICLIFFQYRDIQTYRCYTHYPRHSSDQMLFEVTTTVQSMTRAERDFPLSPLHLTHPLFQTTYTILLNV